MLPSSISRSLFGAGYLTGVIKSFIANFAASLGEVSSSILAAVRMGFGILTEGVWDVDFADIADVFEQINILKI
jgi:6-phosphogluconate dehydrogenase (decarboxylating)